MHYAPNSSLNAPNSSLNFTMYKTTKQTALTYVSHFRSYVIQEMGASSREIYLHGHTKQWHGFCNKRNMVWMICTYLLH